MEILLNKIYFYQSHKCVFALTRKFSGTKVQIVTAVNYYALLDILHRDEFVDSTFSDIYKTLRPSPFYDIMDIQTIEMSYLKSKIFIPFESLSPDRYVSYDSKRQQNRSLYPVGLDKKEISQYKRNQLINEIID